MDVKEICQKIYSIALAVAEKCEAPIAYIVVEKQKSLALDEDTLADAFNKLKWNTALSPSEIEFCPSASPEPLLRVVSLIEFEDEEGNARQHVIDENTGKII